MNLLYELVAAVAIVLGLTGTWLAARHESGWLVCIASSALWLPTLVTGSQWVAVLNCAVSMAICIRNFVVRRGRATASQRVTDAPHTAAEIPEEERWLSTTSS